MGMADDVVVVNVVKLCASTQNVGQLCAYFKCVGLTKKPYDL